MATLLAGCFAGAQTPALKATQAGLVFSKAGSATLTLDYYAGTGVGLHPIAIAIARSGAGEEALTGMLTQVGYDVFCLNGQLISGRPDATPLQAVERAVRFVRFHSREWNGDARKVALIGVGEGGYLSVLVGLANDSGVMGSDDSIDRESARVQAVVGLFEAGEGDGAGGSERWRQTLEPALQEKGREAALAQSSAVYVDPDSPPFLLLDGEKEAASASRAVDLDAALKKVGMRCEVRQLAAGSHDEETAVSEWLKVTLGLQ